MPAQREYPDSTAGYRVSHISGIDFGPPFTRLDRAIVCPGSVDSQAMASIRELCSAGTERCVGTETMPA